MESCQADPCCQSYIYPPHSWSFLVELKFVFLWKKSTFSLSVKSLVEELDYPSSFSHYQSFLEWPGPQKIYQTFPSWQKWFPSPHPSIPVCPALHGLSFSHSSDSLWSQRIQLWEQISDLSLGHIYLIPLLSSTGHVQILFQKLRWSRYPQGPPKNHMVGELEMGCSGWWKIEVTALGDLKIFVIVESFLTSGLMIHPTDAQDP